MPNYDLFDDGRHWDKNTITWWYAGTPAIVQIAQIARGYPATNDFQSLISHAFTQWDQVTTLNFQQVSNINDADIILRWDTIDFGGGSQNILGNATPTFRFGTNIYDTVTIKFDDWEEWLPVNGMERYGGNLDFETSPNFGASFETLALHEIGHALGLDHYDGVSAVMNTNLSTTLTALTQSEIDGIHALYGGGPPQNHKPVATIADRSLQTNEWAQIGSWISYSDSDGNAATQYEFWDSGAAANSGYFWTPGNAHHAAGGAISVAASDLANTWVRGGATGGSETMWVRAFDGTDWSDWDSFTLTTRGNSPPVATINDHTLNANEWSQVGSWISYSDANGNPATQYEFWDSGAASNSGYFWTPSNAHHAAGGAISVAASDLANTWVRGGLTGSSETMWVRAFDGTDWSEWDSFTLTTRGNTPPVATINDHTLNANEWSQVGSWISYSDANGNPATRYEFWDSGAASNSGYFWTPGNAHHAAGGAIGVASSDLANTWVRGGATGGSETMWVRAFDGTDWSEWDSFTLNTRGNTPPVATINDHTVNTNEWSQVASWISYSDANGNPATRYEFWDSGTALDGSYFWNGSARPPGMAISVAASDLANTWVRGGNVGGSETMWVRAFDGTDWSEWDSFTLTTRGNNNTPPVVDITSQVVSHNEWSQVANWISYSDANGDPAMYYQFWDEDGDASSGYFWTPSNSHHPAGGAITVAASEIGSLWISGAQIDKAEAMWVRAFDGASWSAWDPFTLFTL